MSTASTPSPELTPSNRQLSEGQVRTCPSRRTLPLVCSVHALRCYFWTAGQWSVCSRAILLTFSISAERRREQVCSQEEYDQVFKQVLALPTGVEHLIVQIGIPIAYPRMNFLECVLNLS